MEILQVSDVKKTYTTRLGGNRVQALKGVSFSVQEGEYVAIMGESGSGKTTLLNILAALDKPTAGEVLLSGKSLETIPERDLAAFRRDNLGFVFQEFNLLDTFSIEDNILLPLVLAGKGAQEMQQTLLPLAQSLGIEDILHKFPYEVSGGQKQRAAVARAMIAAPSCSWRTSPPGPWIPRPRRIFCGCLKRSTARVRPSSWSPTPWMPPPTPGGCCSSGTVWCSIKFTGASAAISSSIKRSAIP